MEEFSAEIYQGDELVTTAIITLHRSFQGTLPHLMGFIQPADEGVIGPEDYRLVADDGRVGQITVDEVNVSDEGEGPIRFFFSGPFER